MSDSADIILKVPEPVEIVISFGGKTATLCVTQDDLDRRMMLDHTHMIGEKMMVILFDLGAVHIEHLSDDPTPR